MLIYNQGFSMIERFNVNNRKQVGLLLDFIVSRHSTQFYYIEDNAKVYIESRSDLRKFLKECYCSFIQIKKGDCQGIIFVFKRKDENQVKYQVQVYTDSQQVCKDLLTIIAWNVNKDLSTRLHQQSKFVSSFKEKGFRSG
jgi:hypothetical protein